MKTMLKHGRSMGLLAAMALAGCGGDTAARAKTTGTPKTTGAMGGTPGTTAPKTDSATVATADKADAKKADHDHGDGPHGGVVFDLGGGKYHAEFTVSHPKQEATIYILEGGNEKKSAPVKAASMMLNIKQPAFQVELKPAKQASDPEGSSSAFSGKHEKLGLVQEFEGTVTVQIDGKPYAGDFKEVAHDHKK
jgi:hypothetical protein